MTKWLSYYISCHKMAVILHSLPQNGCHVTVYRIAGTEHLERESCCFVFCRTKQLKVTRLLSCHLDSLAARYVSCLQICIEIIPLH